MNAPNQFTRRFAIRMPNAQLYTGHDQLSYEQACQAYADYLAQPSSVRDMAAGLTQMVSMVSGMFVVGPAAPEPPKPPQPQIFDNRGDAEKLLNELRSKATAVGVLGWAGCVVEQLCTPFTSGDPARDFATQIAGWLAEQNGGVQ